MGRRRLYNTDADRQRAHRQRVAARLDEKFAQAGSMRATTVPAKARRAPSRPARLAAVVAEVQQLQHEYEQWLESLPESLQESEQADRLTETVGQLESILDLLSDLNPPRGFGRD